VSGAFAGYLAAFIAGVAVAWYLKDRILERLSRKETKVWAVIIALIIAAVIIVH
jgi:biotin transporter BioY